MWGLIPALNSQGAEPYRQALHKKALEPPVSHEPSVGDVPSSLLSLDDLLPGGRVDMILIRGTSKEPWGFSIEDNGGQNNSCTVEQVISGSIADGQQLMRGDVITAVNGYDVTGLSHRDVMKLIDQSGVELTLTIDPQPVQPFPMQQEPQQQQQRYSHQHPDHQQLYEATERSSRYEARYQGRSGQVNNDDAYTTQRSISAGPSNRDSQDFPASGLTELGWTPGARPKSKSGFQGSLIEPGWRSKSRPQPVMRSSAYVFQNEMGWSTKARGKTTQAYTSNPSSNDMGWSPRVEPVKPTSAFTRVVSNNTGTLSESLNQPVYRRQQQYPPYESESTNMQQYPGPKQQRSQEPQGQQRTKQEYVENPHQSECYQQPEKQITKQEFEQVLKPQYEPQQNPIYDDNAQFLQAIKVQDPSNSEQNAQQQLQSNQYRIPDPQKISSQKIYQNPSEQRHQQKTSDQSQNPYYWSDYGTRRTSRRDRIDDDFVEGVPAWYGSLRPAGGRYDRWNSSTVQGSRSELTDTANKEEKDGWIPHGLDRETRMIQAQTVHAATLPYHPASTRLTAKQAAGQQADRLTAQQAAGLAAQQAAEQQLQKSVELTPQQAAGQQLQQQRRHQKQAYQQQLAQQNLSQTYNNEPHWTNYHKKQSTNQPSISQAVKGGHNDLGLCYGDKKEKYKSDIKDVHLVTATWTVPPQAAGHYEQPISHIGGQVVNVSQVQLYEDRHTYLGQETTQLQPQLPKVPQQFYQAGDEQSQLQTAGLQSEIAVPYQQLSAEAATGNIQNKTISSAFIDFYVLQESVTRHEAAVSFREVQEPEILPVVSKAPAEFSGGFVDFYIIPEGVTLKEINDKSIGTAEQKDFIQQLNETVSRGTGGVATGKTLTGGFVDFYVISEGSGSKALSTSIGKPEEAASKEEIKQVTVGETKTKQPDNIATGSQANALQPQVAHQANDNNNNTKSASSDKVKAANAIDNGKASGIKADIKQISATNAGIINQVVNGKTSNGKISATTPKTEKSAELVGEQMGKSTPQGGQQNRGVPKPQALSTPAAFRDQLKPAKTLPGKLK